MDGDFDAEEWLERFESMREESQAIAAERPTAEQMGQLLLYHAAILHQTLIVRRLEGLQSQSCDDIYSGDWHWHPTPTSMAGSDLRWGDEIAPEFDGNPVRENLDLLQRLVGASIDHLQGVGHLLAYSETVRAPIAAARSALEALATAAFLMNEDVTREERLRRCLNLRLTELSEKRLDGTDDSDDEPDIWQTEIDEIFRGAAACGFSGKNQRPRVYRRAYLEPKPESTQRMIAALLEEDVGSSFWRSMSAVAHSRAASTLLLVDALDTHDGNAQRRSRDVAFNSIMAVLASLQLVPRMQAYLGWDLSDVVGEDDITLRIWSIGAGLQDAVIRRFLFGDDRDTP